MQSLRVVDLKALRSDVQCDLFCRDKYSASNMSLSGITVKNENTQKERNKNIPIRKRQILSICRNL